MIIRSCEHLRNLTVSHQSAVKTEFNATRILYSTESTKYEVQKNSLFVPIRQRDGATDLSRRQ